MFPQIVSKFLDKFILRKLIELYTTSDCGCLLDFANHHQAEVHCEITNIERDACDSKIKNKSITTSKTETETNNLSAES
jgi:hypothetical protein